jgi:hypothetical protein
MSIETVGRGLYDVGCDDCGDVETFVADDWSDLMRQMKESGWTKERSGDEWDHHCQTCSDDDEDDEDDEDEDDDDDDDDE